jgi:hypothetical protein
MCGQAWPSSWHKRIRCAMLILIHFGADSDTQLQPRSWACCMFERLHV